MLESKQEKGFLVPPWHRHPPNTRGTCHQLYLLERNLLRCCCCLVLVSDPSSSAADAEVDLIGIFDSVFRPCIMMEKGTSLLFVIFDCSRTEEMGDPFVY